MIQPARALTGGVDIAVPSHAAGCCAAPWASAASSAVDRRLNRARCLDSERDRDELRSEIAGVACDISPRDT
jgi:hypothetical protein